MNKGILIGFLFIVLLLGGAGAYLFLGYLPNRPDLRYIQLEKVLELPEPEQQEVLAFYEKIAANDEFMSGVVKHTKIAARWEMSEEQAIKALRGRLHLKLNPKGGLQVGFKGKRKEKNDLNILSQTLFGAGSKLLSKNHPSFRDLFTN